MAMMSNFGKILMFYYTSMIFLQTLYAINQIQYSFHFFQKKLIIFIDGTIFFDVGTLKSTKFLLRVLEFYLSPVQYLAVTI